MNLSLSLFSPLLVLPMLIVRSLGRTMTIDERSARTPFLPLFLFLTGPHRSRNHHRIVERVTEDALGRRESALPSPPLLSFPLPPLFLRCRRRGDGVLNESKKERHQHHFSPFPFFLFFLPLLFLAARRATEPKWSPPMYEEE